jgi:hypothetical protein
MAATPAYKPGTYDSPGDIFDAMYGFRTFNHEPIEKLLQEHGLHITLVAVDTVEFLGPQDGERPGDVVYDIYVEGVAPKDMPCGMSGLIGTSDEPDIEEFIRRKGRFPVADENGQNPTGKLMFWAATGRCSKAY